jgi:DNA repair exonuclease SbcCD ATPase subunit
MSSYKLLEEYCKRLCLFNKHNYNPYRPTGTRTDAEEIIHYVSCIINESSYLIANTMDQPTRLSYETTIKSLQSTIVDLTEQVRLLVQDKDQLENIIPQLRVLNDDVQNRLDQANKKLESITLENKSISEQNTKILKERDNLSELINTVRKQNSTITKDLEEKLSKANTLVSQLKEKLKDKDTKFEKLKQNYEKLKEKAETLKEEGSKSTNKKKLQDLQNKLQDLQNKLQDLQNKLQDLQNQNKKLTECAKQAQEDVVKKQDEISKKTLENDELKEKLQALEKRKYIPQIHTVSFDRKDQIEFDRQIASLKAENEQLKTKNSLLEYRIDTVKNTFIGFQANILSLVNNVTIDSDIPLKKRAKLIVAKTEITPEASGEIANSPMDETDTEEIVITRSKRKVVNDC